MTDVWSPYSETVIEHFKNPRNVEEMENAEGFGQAGNPVCGDITELYIKVNDGTIVDAKFKTFGCAASIASSSTLTEMLIGKSMKEALKVSTQEVVEALGGLPPAKLHCSVMAEEALKSAIEDYLSKSKKKDENE